MKLRCYILLFLLVFYGYSSVAQRKFNGHFKNGNGKISFVLSADGKFVSQVIFSGVWRCGGGNEKITAGPDQTFAVTNGIIKGFTVDPVNGGASAFRFDIQGNVSDQLASGIFRMYIKGLACDTYKLRWVAKSY